MNRQGRRSVAEVVETTISNQLAEIPRVADLFETFARRHRFGTATVHDVQVCLDEILSNIVRHAFTDSARHRIDILIKLDGSQVVIEVTDDGRPFDPAVFTPAPTAAKSRRKPGGVGIYFVQKLMDELTYQRDGAVNRLVAKKSIQGARR